MTERGSLMIQINGKQNDPEEIKIEKRSQTTSTYQVYEVEFLKIRKLIPDRFLRSPQSPNSSQAPQSRSGVPYLSARNKEPVTSVIIVPRGISYRQGGL